jgi:UDP-3-O-[3-hydroxymyristoyl] glucosamine N-acyltransferase
MSSPTPPQTSPVRVTLRELAAVVGGTLFGPGDQLVSRLASLETAQADCITFVSQARYAALLQSTRAGCVIVAPALQEQALARRGGLSGPVTVSTAGSSEDGLKGIGAGPSANFATTLVCHDPYFAFAKLTQWWARRTRAAPAIGVHASAVVEPGAHVHPLAAIGPLAYVGSAARLAAGAVVGAQAHVGAGASVGEATVLKPRVMLGDHCSIGSHGLVHSGAVIGADGFGFAPHQGQWEKIEQLGAVRIGDGVEIGANTCIDRGALEDTVVEDGVKLDNLVQIGHNVHIGAHTAFAGCVGVAGSARIGRHCTAGGGAIILGHLEIVDHVHITAATVITRSIHKPGQYSGLFPFDDNGSWEKNAATLRQLHALRDRLRALEKRT